MILNCYVTDDSISELLQDMTEYISLCYRYPLIIFKRCGIISFYSVIVRLEPKEISLLLELIKNKTQKNKNNKLAGLSTKRLCSKICSKSRTQHTSEKYYDKRIAQFKSDIITKIKNGFKTDEISLQHSNSYNIVEEINRQKFLRGLMIEPSSPYYSFNLPQALNDLIYYSSETGKKKVSTNFSYEITSSQLN